MVIKLRFFNAVCCCGQNSLSTQKIFCMRLKSYNDGQNSARFIQDQVFPWEWGSSSTQTPANRPPCTEEYFVSLDCIMYIIYVFERNSGSNLRLYLDLSVRDSAFGFRLHGWRWCILQRLISYCYAALRCVSCVASDARIKEARRRVETHIGEEPSQT